jgi:DNA-binding MarR family transcriptional regulator
MEKKAAPGRRKSEPPVTFENGDNWLDRYLPYSLYRVSALMSARLNSKLNAMKINPSEWRVLSVLRSYGCLNISSIVQYAVMEQPTASRVVTNLHRDGLVYRRPSRDDSRMVEVSITERGLEMFEEIRSAATRHQVAALSSVSEEDVAKLRDVLRQLERNLLPDE